MSEPSIFDKSSIITQKYNEKYNGGGKIKYKAHQFTGDGYSSKLRRQKSDFAQDIKNAQGTLKKGERLVVLMAYCNPKDERFNHARSLILTKNYCFLSDSAGGEPNLAPSLQKQGLKVVPVLNYLQPIPESKKKSFFGLIGGNRVEPMRDEGYYKVSFIQSGSRGCAVLAGNIAKWIANQSDSSLEKGVIKAKNFKRNGVKQITEGSEFAFDFTKTGRLAPLLNVLKYSENPRFEEQTLKFYGLHGKLDFDPNLGIRSDGAKLKPRIDMESYLSKNTKHDPANPKHTRGALTNKDERITNGGFYPALRGEL